MEALSGKLDAMSGKYRTAEDGNRELEARIERLERRLRDSEEQNQDLQSSVSKREDLVHQHNVSTGKDT